MAVDAAAPWTAVGLSEEEYGRIAARLRRPPNAVELGMFGAMWSEHCSYKSSRRYLRRLPTAAPHVLVGPGENAGVIDLGGGHAIAVRMESHNHPSAIEPFEGAATGVGGILRDIFTMGARPVALLDGLRFGAPSGRSRWLARGVVGGIAHYGNATGVPTVGGETTFDPDYADNPLVNVMCVGFLRTAHLQRGAAPGPGNVVLLIGNRTGRDGIHGASLLASRTFAERPEELRPAVQVGDPFVGKLVMEACLELAERGALRGCNDLGAAGLTSAASETAGRAGTGIALDLDRVPCREPAMDPYEIMLSESQERMLVVAAPEDVATVAEVCRRYGVQAARIGRVTAGRRLQVRHGGRTVASVPVGMLTRDAPSYARPSRRPAPARRLPAARPDLTEGSAAETLLALLSAPDGASKRWVYRQYDHQVQTQTAVGPGAADAAVLWHRPTGQGVALSLDMSGRICGLDPFGGAALLVAEAARNVACVGARPLGLTNCLNFASPEDPAVMGAFAATIAGMASACRHLQIPVTGGNVSFYNETAGHAIPPTPAVGMVGVIGEVGRARGAGLPAAGLAVALIGPLRRSRVDGGAYQSLRFGAAAGAPLRPEWPTERALLDLLAGLGYVLSAHDCADGGIAVALAECVLMSPVGAGMSIRLPVSRRLDDLLFGEGPGRVVVALPQERLSDLRAACGSVACHTLGRSVDGGGLQIAVGDRPLVALSRDDLGRWEEALPQWMQ